MKVFEYRHFEGRIGRCHNFETAFDDNALLAEIKTWDDENFCVGVPSGLRKDVLDLARREVNVVGMFGIKGFRHIEDNKHELRLILNFIRQDDTIPAKDEVKAAKKEAVGE